MPLLMPPIKFCVILLCIISQIYCNGDTTNADDCNDNRKCCTGLRKYNYVFTMASDENLNINPAVFGALDPFFSFGGFSAAKVTELREDAEDWFLTRFGFNFSSVPLVTVDGCEQCKFLVVDGQTIVLSPLFFNSTVRVISTFPAGGFDIYQVPSGNKCTRIRTLEYLAFIPDGVTYGGAYGNDPRLAVTHTVGSEVIAFGYYVNDRGNKRRLNKFKSVYPARLEQVFTPFSYEVDHFVFLDEDLGVCSVSIASRVDGFGTAAPFLSNQRFVLTCPGSFSQPEFNIW